jgi:hypothetical protein
MAWRPPVESIGVKSAQVRQTVKVNIRSRRFIVSRGENHPLRVVST